MRKMRAKYPGTCRGCGGAVRPGDLIWWARGSAVHADCTAAKNRESLCTACGGSGRQWNGADCRQCAGTGMRDVADRARGRAADNSGVEDRECGDLAYEDRCREVCGL